MEIIANRFTPIVVLIKFGVDRIVVAFCQW